jgi:CHAT domain-containing protein/pimeloyl-ACP methyl ester carboxylesterase
MQVNKLIVTGFEQATAPGPALVDDSAVKEYVVERSSRGLTESHTVDISNGEVVELRFEDGTVWLCNGDTIGESFPEVVPATRSGEQAFLLPTQLSGPGSERSLFDTIALKIVRIFAKKAVDQVVAKGVRELAEDLEKKQLDGRSGLFALSDDFMFDEVQEVALGQPYLLFLHGTASSTAGSFGGLQDSELWSYLRTNYGAGILAFQHESLTKSPLQNTLELIQALPTNCVLHLVSHSRGGLIGELLARFCNGDGANLGFDHSEKEYLAKARFPDDQDLIHIQQISAELANRRIAVRKFVRVACPAGGTILASERLERFFNISLNLLGYATGLAANPIYGAFKDLISAILGSKDDVEVLPGLEAMNPASPFIKVLNNPITTVQLDSPLVVISGNCTVKPGLKALLVLVSKLFYLKDNDLVVNTLSMYRGARRTRAVQYYFDASPEIDHFHYFVNPRTVKLLLQALQATTDAPLPGFATIDPFEGILSERNAALGLEGGVLNLNRVSGTKPIVLLLPGIMGSTLATGTSPLWINYPRFIVGDLVDLAITNSGITPTGIVRTSYKRLADYLAPNYDVVTFAFDWRLSLPDSARLLEERLQELLRFKQPIKLVAHSMGGVLVRDFILQHPATWQALNHSSGFQLLMLGTPILGSFRIPAVLMGLDGLINKLAGIDFRHSKEDLIRIFAQFPGILNLLPISEQPGEDFSQKSTWEAMLEAVGGPADMLPADDVLQQFGQYRAGVLAAIDKNSPDQIGYGNAVYIAGRGDATPSGYRITERHGRKKLEFDFTADGDQSVTWANGIPQQLPAQAVYYVDVPHGALADDPSLFAGISDILAKGATSVLSHARPIVRGQLPKVPLASTEDFDLSEAGVVRTLLGLPAVRQVRATARPLRVRVANGDLRYATFPLLAGHFSNDGIQYAEKAVDEYLLEALSQRRNLGSYPGPIGSSEFFLSAGADYQGALVLGLGEFGQLTAFRLTQTVEQGVSKYLHGLAFGNLPGPRPAVIGLSSLIIGSSYGGLTVASSVRAILQGVQNANAKLRRLLGEQAPAVSAFEFIELYEDLAVSCIYAVRNIEQEENAALPVEVERKPFRKLFGARKRMPVDQSSNWWNQLSVRLPAEDEECPGRARRIQFTLSMGGAREEQRQLLSNRALIEQFLQDISVNNSFTAESAKIVYELLIPNDLKESLQRQSNLSWVVDKETAAYPWELLQDTVNDNKPLCVNAGMIRRLATPDYRLRIVRSVQDTALVIGDPNLGGFLPPLAPASEEAHTVSTLLSASLQPVCNVGGTATSVIRDLFKQDYKVVHLAGHGVFLPDRPESSGMVIGNGLYLSAQEIDQMSSVPELVFVNCCYLGQTVGTAEQQSRDRYKLAANLGTQLIEIGVKAVVVAGWAVDDAAALLFAQVFYSLMVNGTTFGEAVLNARRTVYEQTRDRSNTWGAYQCYGDPFYKLRNVAASSGARARDYVIAEEAELELINFYNEIQGGRHDAEQVLREVEAIREGVDRCGLSTPAITEREAYIYQELHDFERASSKFEALLTEEIAGYSVVALEKGCNTRAKLSVQLLARSAITPAVAQQQINNVIGVLLALLRIGRTKERLSLLGSAYKRLSMTVPANRPKLLKTYRTAASYYAEAATVPKKNGYALTNWYSLEAICVFYGQEWGSANATKNLPLLSEAQEQLQGLIAETPTGEEDMDYWDMAGAADARLCLLMLGNGTTPANIADLIQRYRTIWRKAGSPGKRMAEIEHLAFLLHALQQAPPSASGTQLIALLEGLHNELSQP